MAQVLSDQRCELLNQAAVHAQRFERAVELRLIRHVAHCHFGIFADRVDLPDDEYVPIMAIQTVDKARAVDAMDRLRELVAKYRPDLSSASKTS